MNAQCIFNRDVRLACIHTSCLRMSDNCHYHVIVVSLLWASLIPRLCLTFCCLQNRKVGRARDLSPCEHDVIRKWQQLLEATGNVFLAVQPTTQSMLGVYGSRPLLRAANSHAFCMRHTHLDLISLSHAL